MSNLSRIKTIVHISNLDYQDMDNFIDFLSRIDEDDLAILIELFEKKPSWVSKFYQNILTKKEVLNKKDKKGWQKIIEKEKADLLKL